MSQLRSIRMSTGYTITAGTRNTYCISSMRDFSICLLGGSHIPEQEIHYEEADDVEYESIQTRACLRSSADVRGHGVG